MKKYIYLVFIIGEQLWYLISEESAEKDNMEDFIGAVIRERKSVESDKRDARLFGPLILELLEKGVLFGERSIYGPLDSEEDEKNFFALVETGKMAVQS